MPNHSLERFLKDCQGVIIHIADVRNPFTIDDVERNGLEDDEITWHLDFVQTFWTNMVDKLDVEIDDSVDNYVRHHLRY